MSAASPRALVADDEPMLRARLIRRLKDHWPELEIVAEAKHGGEAVEAYERLSPDICFLDVQMPGMAGIDAARLIGGRAHIVFVTAFQQYAIDAFEHGALDYLVKPVDAARLAQTVERLKRRLATATTPDEFTAMLDAVASRLLPAENRAALRWLKVSAGNVVKVVHVDSVDFFRAEEKYTLVAWRDEEGRPFEGVVRTPIRDLLPQLDPQIFVQIQRAVIVSLASVKHVVRLDNETAQVHLRNRKDVLPVSRNFVHVFRHM